jgi:membrane-associated protein
MEAFAQFILHSRYVLLFIGTLLEGPVVMLGAGVLWHVGLVNFLPALAALFAGDVVADIIWYTVGYRAGRPFVRRYGHWFGFAPDTIEKVERRFHTYHSRILIISKLTMGFGLAVPILTVAGLLRTPFYRFLTINMAAGVLWTSFMMFIGYYFGNIIATMPRDLQIGVIVVLLTAAFVFLRHLSTRLAQVDW